jgi:hypothetical protein
VTEKLEYEFWNPKPKFQLGLLQKKTQKQPKNYNKSILNSKTPFNQSKKIN